jgi:hypothetical protein
MRIIATMLVLVVASRSARADVEGKCVELVCDDRTARPGRYSCDTPACYCTDTCDGSSGSTANQNSAAMAQGMAKLLGYTVLGVAFLFMPGHMSQWTSKDGKKQSVKEARQAWDDFNAKRTGLVQVGRDAEKARAAYWTLDAEERAELRDAPAAKPKLKPFNPPKLKPDPQWQCNNARLLMPSVHTGGPIGQFPSERAMRDECKARSEPPVTPDAACSPTSFRCGTGNPEFCCPRSHPIFNFCDEQCYRTTDFLGAEDDKGLHCQTSRDCGSFNP